MAAEAMTGPSERLLAGLVAVDGVSAVVAVRERIAGEPFGIGGSLDVRHPAVLTFWGTGLSAPIALLAAAIAARRRPPLLRALGAMFAVGALAEPVFWGRRPCPRYARRLLVLHVGLAVALAAQKADD